MKNDHHSRPVLREAAGCFWLVDTAQEGRPYIHPIRLNDTGAEIWRGLSDGRTPEEIAAGLAEREGASAEEVLEDVKAFIDSIERELAKRE